MAFNVYKPGSIETAAIANDAITNALIADDQLDSEHYAAASVDNAHLANSAVTIGATSTALGTTVTAFTGLTGLDFTAANASIGANIGAKTYIYTKVVTNKVIINFTSKYFAIFFVFYLLLLI